MAKAMWFTFKGIKKKLGQPNKTQSESYEWDFLIAGILVDPEHL